MRHLFFLIFVLSAFLTAFADEAMPHRITAHRGASAKKPENTLPAFKQAIADGANAAECDVHITKDGVLVLSHDGTTKRTLQGKPNERIADLDYAELKERDAGAWKGKAFRGKGIYAPTLAEYLQTLKETKTYPIIEIKIDGIADKVIAAVKKEEMLAKSTVIAFSEKTIKDVRRIEPKMRTAWLHSEKLNKKETAEQASGRFAEILLKQCKELDITILDLEYSMLSKTLVKKLQENKINVWAWTVDDPKVMEQLLDWNVDAVTTNKPDVLRDVIERRKRYLPTLRNL